MSNLKPITQDNFQVTKFTSSSIVPDKYLAMAHIPPITIEKPTKELTIIIANTGSSSTPDSGCVDGFVVVFSESDISLIIFVVKSGQLFALNDCFVDFNVFVEKISFV